MFTRSEQGGCEREQIRGGRARRRSPPGRDRVDYEYDIDDIENGDEDDFGDFEKGETTSASDSANDDAAVSMIPDIADIISAGDDDDDGGGGGRGQWRRQQRVLPVGKEDGDDRYDIGGGDGWDINDREIEDENDDDNNDDDENDGDGDDEEGYGRSDEEEIRDNGEDEDDDDRLRGGSASTKFGEEEERSEEEALGGRRDEGGGGA